MQVFAAFDHSSYLEMAISQLVQEGISKEKILAVSLQKTSDSMKLMDSIHHSDGVSLFDTGAALATAFAVIGVSIGFRLNWGPVYWGLIGAGGGLLLGFLINFLYYKVIKKKKFDQKKKQKETEVIIVIECHDDFYKEIEKILKGNFAISIGFVR